MKREEERKQEAERARLKEQEKGFFKERLRRSLYELGLRKIQFPGTIYRYDRDEDLWNPITEENDVILNMYELQTVLDKLPTQDTSTETADEAVQGRKWSP